MLQRPRFCFPVLLAVLFARAAMAEDQPFLTLDATDIEPQFGREFEQDLVWTTGPAALDGLQMQSELDYGLYDDLQIGGTIDYAWERFDSPASSFRFIDAGGEIIYRPLNVYFDPLGLAVLVSGSAGPDVRDVEVKLLAQKNFINDRLRLVVNGGWIGAEQRAAEPAENQWSSASTLEWSAGAAYNVTWNWSACVEFDYDRSFGGVAVDGRGTRSSSVYYLGPTLQYAAPPLTVSLGFQAQLPWASGGSRAALNNGFALDAERYRVALRITRSF